MASGNKPGTPYEPCFTPLTSHVLKHVSAPREEWEKALNPIGPFYRLSAFFRDEERPMKEETVSEQALGLLTEMWARMDGVACLMVHPL